MLTRTQKKVNNQVKYLKNKRYHNYWFTGKRYENSGVRYKLKEANYYLKDRCNGEIYKNFNTYIGEYTCPQTRGMSRFIDRRNYMNRKWNRYCSLLRLKRTRAMTNYLKYYHYKYFRYDDPGLKQVSL